MNIQHQVIHQGHQISIQMKADITDQYYKSLQNEKYKNKAEYIKNGLEYKYGKSWSIFVTSKQALGFQFSFQLAEEFLLEFQSPEHRVLAYLSQPIAPQQVSFSAPVYPQFGSLSTPKRSFMNYPYYEYGNYVFPARNYDSNYRTPLYGSQLRYY